MLLIIDNYDSFTHNLVRYCQELGCAVKIYQNDKITASAINQLKPSHLLLAPGPGRPEDAGISMQVVADYAGILPILGVCLGHQVIAQTLGADIIRAQQIMHGKTSLIHHKGSDIFNGLPNPLTVTRYHSLAINPSTLPANLKVTAWTTAPQQSYAEVMAIADRQQALYGVQFHPEALCTEYGHQLLANFLAIDRPNSKLHSRQDAIAI